MSFRGLSLREDDEAGYRMFDRHFGRLQSQVERQDPGVPARDSLPDAGASSRFRWRWPVPTTGTIIISCKRPSSTAV